MGGQLANIKLQTGIILTKSSTAPNLPSPECRQAPDLFSLDQTFVSIDERLTEGVDDLDISFLLELIKRRYMSKSTVLCTQYTPAEWHGRLGSGVQADAMVDRLVHGSVRINLGDVNVRKLLTEKR